MKHLKIKIDKYDVDGNEILRNIEFTLNKSDRLAIVGGNGSGKTTILKIITGEIKNYDGIIENIGSVSLGYLAQIYNDDENKTVYEELKDGFADIIVLEKELAILEEELQMHSVIPAEAGISSKEKLIENTKDSEILKSNVSKEASIRGSESIDSGSSPEGQLNLLQQYSDKLEHFNNMGGYNYNSILMGVASGLGIVPLLKSPLTQISGGQRTKVALAKILIHSPDILFLDEPTNFIDMASLEWLEYYLQNKWKGGYVIVSHDREFLDKTCEKTYEVQPARALSFYHCNYSDYVIEREKKEKKVQEDFERQDDWIKSQEGLVNRFRAGSRAGWAKSREKMLEKIDRIEPPYIPHKAKFIFNETENTSEKILTFKQIFIGRKDPLFFINDLVLYKGQKIGIVGENGVGKSTFIKSILGQLDFLDGYFSKAKLLKIGYYSQMHDELKKDKTIRENFELQGLNYSEQVLVSILKHYIFDYEDLNKKVGDLSGGQISKVAFAILGQKEFDLLILDEPTNHLDYDTREALETALKKFKGTVLFISHDRYFVNKIATNIWIIKDSELIVSYGNYEDYRYKLEFGINMDMSLFDEEGQLNFVLEEKLGEKEVKRLKNKFKKFGKKK